MLAGRARADSLLRLEERARSLEALGFDSLWIPHVFGFDAIMLAALVGRATERIEIGTAVVPTAPRHPAALAQAALTTGASLPGRFTLGIGLSHPAVIEGMFGLSSSRPALQMRETLDVLMPLLRGEPVSHRGPLVRAEVALEVPGAPPPPVLVAALGERMLDLAGRQADGTLLWMTGPRTIADHVVPRLEAGARAAGRSSPRVVAGVNLLVTSDVEAVRPGLDQQFAMYRQLPSYRAVIDREGSDDPLHYGVVGDERRVEAGLDRLRDAGVTDVEAYLVRGAPEDEARTLAFLADRARP